MSITDYINFFPLFHHQFTPSRILPIYLCALDSAWRSIRNSEQSFIAVVKHRNSTIKGKCTVIGAILGYHIFQLIATLFTYIRCDSAS